MTTVAFMGYLGPLSSQGLNMYDVVVIGAGPGGGSAALHAARAGLSTLHLEADPQIGTPVHFGECMSESVLYYPKTICTQRGMFSENFTQICFGRVGNKQTN